MIMDYQLKDKCPCENCICIPVCRNKLYAKLFDDCAHISRYIQSHQVKSARDSERISKVYSILKPESWEIKYDGRYSDYPLIFIWKRSVDGRLFRDDEKPM